ncbi:MAG TPA: thermonuclease family protein [Sphingomicrobium sp.]|jgi:endonuclease YncB( thermonuclease family)
MLFAIVACFSPWVVDGDSLRCRGPGGYVGEVRLLGIDAADRRSSRPCRERFGNHRCDDRLAKAGKASLMRLIRPLRARGEVLRLERAGRDRYGRLLAIAWAGKVNLNCRQIEQRVARYIPDYDNGFAVRRACRLR